MHFPFPPHFVPRHRPSRRARRISAALAALAGLVAVLTFAGNGMALSGAGAGKPRMESDAGAAAILAGAEAHPAAPGRNTAAPISGLSGLSGPERGVREDTPEDNTAYISARFKMGRALGFNPSSLSSDPGDAADQRRYALLLAALSSVAEEQLRYADPALSDARAFDLMIALMSDLGDGVLDGRDRNDKQVFVDDGRGNPVALPALDPTGASPWAVQILDQAGQVPDLGEGGVEMVPVSLPRPAGGHADVEPGDVCIQVIAAAVHDETGECREFATPCDVPERWTPTGGSSCGAPGAK